MQKGIRTVCYDEELRLEAYCLEGVVQPFPHHFHEYYVVGLMEDGERNMTCKNRDYTLSRGDIVLFNPGDSHACAPKDGKALFYRAVNITVERLQELALEVTGSPALPGFSQCVVRDGELACCLRPLHEAIMAGSTEFEKEEYLLLAVSLLLERYSQPFESVIPECRAEVEAACAFMDAHYAERISLEQLCNCASLSKSTLLRAFTKSKGVTPYRYLEAVRVGAAKKLLEQGVAPADAALCTGFSDQSHFTNFFTNFIGLTPGAYRDIFLAREK